MIDQKKFKRTKEDFVCENCGAKIIGNGYTNHCSKCLWCKHVDINPGDRLNECQGLMQPIGVELIKNDYRLIHKCLKCGALKKNKISSDDDFQLIIALSGKMRP